jgi:hypothetical protein
VYITTNNEILKIIREYLENLLSSKLDNLDEMGIYWDAYNHPKLNHEDIKHLNSPIIFNGIEGIVKSISKKKSPEPDGFSLVF